MRDTLRLPQIDVLRGIALLGILLVNFSSFNSGLFDAMPGAAGRPSTVGGAVNGAAELLVSWLFASKFILIFSFLFGWGVHTQAQEGPGFRGRYLRRLAGLLLIGLVHGIFFFSGDVLVTYAVLGLFMLRPVKRDWPVRRIVRSAIVLQSVTLVIFALVAGVAIAISGSSTGDSGQDGGLFAQSRQIYATGTFLEVSRQRLIEVAVMVPLAITILGSGLVAMFRLGYAAAKFVSENGLVAGQMLARRLLLWTLVPGLVLSLLCAYLGQLKVEPLSGATSWMMPVLAGPVLAIGYIAAASLLLEGALLRRLTSTFGATGRMSLSVYLSQSVIMSVLFSGYGFGLGGTVGAAMGIGICVAVFAVLVALAMLWQQRLAIGPAEWVLRCITRWRIGGMKPDPERRTRTAVLASGTA